MKNQILNKAMRKVCSESEIKKGLCGCKVEARIGQNNLIPRESTDLICSKKINLQNR